VTYTVVTVTNPLINEAGATYQVLYLVVGGGNAIARCSSSADAQAIVDALNAS
jgi:hypothetical protein